MVHYLKAICSDLSTERQIKKLQLEIALSVFSPDLICLSSEIPGALTLR